MCLIILVQMNDMSCNHSNWEDAVKLIRSTFKSYNEDF